MQELRTDNSQMPILTLERSKRRPGEFFFFLGEMRLGEIFKTGIKDRSRNLDRRYLPRLQLRIGLKGIPKFTYCNNKPIQFLSQ